MRDLLLIPEFARITDYFGPWAMEAKAFADLWAYARSMDWSAHFAQQAISPPARPAVEMVNGRGGKSVARIPIRGLMMKGQSSMGGTSTVQLRRDIRQAASDPNVSGILLDISSPGGTVAGQSDLVDEVKRAKRAKPIWSQIEDMGASAAYYLAAASDAIFANNSDAQIGSIGTLMAIADSSVAAEREGVKVHLFTTGPLKGMGFDGTPLTEEQQAHAQTLVNGWQAGFDTAVKNGRLMNAAELAAVRTGGVFLAPEAKRLKLIDGIRSVDSTLAALAAAG